MRNRRRKAGTGSDCKSNQSSGASKAAFYLETPNDLEGYAGEIALLRNSYKEL